MNLKKALFATASLFALSTHAWGQDADTIDLGTIWLNPIIVSGDLVPSLEVLHGEELVRRRQFTLGETLSGIPGIHSDTFGGGASRPVMRGQTAPRVKVLTWGSAVMDASEVSPDHAVSGSPLLLEGIEVLRGPSALLFGGGAIGGAVNLIDTRIPTAAPADGFNGSVDLLAGTGDNARAGAIGLTAGRGPLVFRFEAERHDADDYEVPGFATPTVPGTFTEGSTVTGGLSWVGARGFIGLAYTEQRSKYGLPGHNHDYESCHAHGSSLHCGEHEEGDHDHDHDHAGADVPTVDLLSRRWDLRGEIEDPFTGIERLRFSGGYTDYRHHEIDDGEIATTFTNKGYDLRIEAQHAPILGLRGVLGAQLSRSDFAALGTEAFLPESRTDNRAIFLFEEYTLGDWRFEGALRKEWQDASADGKPDTNHNPFSVSAAARWTFTPGYVASLSLAHSERAPTAQELYARGVHLATNTYEIGSAGLDVEASRSIELSLSKIDGPTTFSASLYRYNYDGYIYGRTLDRFEDFRLIEYTQEDARFTGIEVEVTHTFSPGLSATVFGDYVRAELKGSGENLPRIPAGRLGTRLDFVQGAWSGDLEYMRVFEQDRIAGYETTTPGYNMVNATIAYDVDIGRATGQVFLRGTNLFDERALNHTSFIKDAAPLRGRNLTIGLRTTF